MSIKLVVLLYKQQQQKKNHALIHCLHFYGFPTPTPDIYFIAVYLIVENSLLINCKNEIKTNFGIIKDCTKCSFLCRQVSLVFIFLKK